MPLHPWEAETPLLDMKQVVPDSLKSKVNSYGTYCVSYSDQYWVGEWRGLKGEVSAKILITISDMV